MKKLSYFICALLVIALISSCKVHERCPAYGKIEKEKVERSV